MIKILFICHGNICRSPMAEFILKDMIQRRHLTDRFLIASAATSTEEIWRGMGNPVYPPARAEHSRSVVYRRFLGHVSGHRGRMHGIFAGASERKHNIRKTNKIK